MNFNWYKAIGFGALIWAIMFALASAIVGFGVAVSVGWSLTLAVVIGVVTYLFAMNARSETAGQALGYGAVFTAVGVVLDLVISWQFVSGLFSMWTYYVGYALVLLAPLVEFGFRGDSTAPITR